MSIIILSTNSQIKEDLKASSSKLLYGQCLRFPGDLFIPSAPTHTSSASKLIDNMRLFSVSLQPISTRVQQSDPVHLPNTLNTCSHVFIKDDPIHPNLTPAYSGPFEVVTRNNHIGAGQLPVRFYLIKR